MEEEMKHREEERQHEIEEEHHREEEDRIHEERERHDQWRKLHEKEEDFDDSQYSVAYELPMPPLPTTDYYHSVKSPELEPFGTRDEDDEDEDKDRLEEDPYVSVLPKHHHTFDEDDYFFS